MYAIFSTGGKQYRAVTGDTIKVEKLDAETGATVELDQVLLVGEGGDVEVGTPLVSGGKVTARVVEHGRGDKIKVLKFKRRKHHMKRQGHRQYYTMLEITGITGAGSDKKAQADDKAEAVEESKAAPKKATAKKAASKEAGSKKAASKKAASKKTASKKTAAKKSATRKAAAKAEKADDANSEE